LGKGIFYTLESKIQSLPAFPWLDLIRTGVKDIYGNLFPSKEGVKKWKMEYVWEKGSGAVYVFYFLLFCW
jgi:hypothetical protein